MIQSLTHLMHDKNRVLTLCDLPFKKEDNNLKIEYMTEVSENYLRTAPTLCRECAGLVLRQRRLAKTGANRNTGAEIFDYNYQVLEQMIREIRNMSIEANLYDGLYNDEFYVCLIRYMNWCKEQKLTWDNVVHGVCCDRANAIFNKTSKQMVDKWESIVKEYLKEEKKDVATRDIKDVRRLNSIIRALHKDINSLYEELNTMQEIISEKEKES